MRQVLERRSLWHPLLQKQLRQPWPRLLRPHRGEALCLQWQLARWEQAADLLQMLKKPLKVIWNSSTHSDLTLWHISEAAYTKLIFSKTNLISHHLSTYFAIRYTKDGLLPRALRSARLRWFYVVSLCCTVMLISSTLIRPVHYYAPRAEGNKILLRDETWQTH